MLIQLPNGDWLDPKTATEVYSCDEVKNSEFTHGIPHRVVVRKANGNDVVIYCETSLEADEMCDRIASQVNGPQSLPHLKRDPQPPAH